jgi:single-strand DNA-binding protein
VSLRFGVNRVTLIGELVRDPELRYTPEGQPVTSLAVATRQRFTASDGELMEADERFNVVAWGDLAERCARTMHQGEHVFVAGRLQTRSWEDKEGARHFMAEVVAGEMLALGHGREAAD